MIKVLYEDNHLIAVNKPWGMLVQGDQTGDVTMADYVKQYIKDRYKKPGAVYLGIPHRIDRVVSGLVIYARTSKALERMNKMFRDQEVEKTYIISIRINPAMCLKLTISKVIGQKMPSVRS
jgi:23S rRNA pseudouridine1911/1915/1917 synthase